MGRKKGAACGPFSYRRWSELFRRHFSAFGTAGTLRLGDPRFFAAQAAQVIELGAPHFAAAQDTDRVDHRRVKREHALDAFAVGNLAYGEIFVDAATRPADANAFVGLHAGFVAFDHLDVDEKGVARLKVGNFLPGRKFFNLLFFELLNDVHYGFSVGSASNRRAVLIWSEWVGAACITKLSACHPLDSGRFLGVLRAWYAAQRSGRRSKVSRSASARRQAFTLLWSPEVSTSGIGSPSKTGGRVYCGYSSSPSAKLSSAADASLPMTPGKSLTQASSSASAAISPPESTKSPSETSSIRRVLMSRSSTPSKRAQTMTAPSPRASSATRYCVRRVPRGLISRRGLVSCGTESSARASTSAFMTMPGPPPAGVSSTVRCLSVACARMSTVSSDQTPDASALPARLCASGPGNISGKMVNTLARHMLSCPALRFRWVVQ